MKKYLIWQYEHHYDNDGYDASNLGDPELFEDFEGEDEDAFFDRFIREKMTQKDFEEIADSQEYKEIHIVAFISGENTNIKMEPQNPQSYFDARQAAYATRKERYEKKRREEQEKRAAERLKAEREQYERLKKQFETP
jgi:hypothetical protein